MRLLFFFFKQKTAYEMRISDWSSYVCSSDLMKHHRTTPLAVPEGYTTLSRLLAGVAEMERAGAPGLRARLLASLGMAGEVAASRGSLPDRPEGQHQERRCGSPAGPLDAPPGPPVSDSEPVRSIPPCAAFSLYSNPITT